MNTTYELNIPDCTGGTGGNGGYPSYDVRQIVALEYLKFLMPAATEVEIHRGIRYVLSPQNLLGCLALSLLSASASLLGRLSHSLILFIEAPISVSVSVIVSL